MSGVGGPRAQVFLFAGEGPRWTEERQTIMDELNFWEVVGAEYERAAGVCMLLLWPA